VEILGENEIERLTYIRGAARVIIGPDVTTIEFPCWKELVIPRLRLGEKEPADALVWAKNVPVEVDRPVPVLIRQFADGRHVGGVQLRLLHPDYKSPEVEPKYDLWVRVLDAKAQKPLAETRVEIWHFDPEKEGPAGTGTFFLDDQRWTDGHGCVEALGRPAGELEAVAAHLPGWRVTPRCFRPLAGQPVRITLRAWPMQPSKRKLVWQGQGSLEDLAARCGCDSRDLLKLNRLRDPSELTAGTPIRLPCFAAALRPDPWDTPQAVAQRFRIDEKDLAAASGLGDLAKYDGSADLQLPGWDFFHAGPSDILGALDEMFLLPPGSCVAAGRAFRPLAGLLYSGEVVGVPR
jgi:hypothetical protein